MKRLYLTERCSWHQMKSKSVKGSTDIFKITLFYEFSRSGPSGDQVWTVWGQTRVIISCRSLLSVIIILMKTMNTRVFWPGWWIFLIMIIGTVSHTQISWKHPWRVKNYIFRGSWTLGHHFQHCDSFHCFHRSTLWRVPKEILTIKRLNSWIFNICQPSESNLLYRL